MRVFFCTIVLVFLFFNNSAFAETDKEKLKKIDDQLISIKNLFENGVLDETTYEDSKQKLLSKKSLIQNKNKNKKKSKKGTSALEDQLKVIKKLFDDGVLSEEEYLKTKKFLEDNASLDVIKEIASGNHEKAEITEM